MNFQRMWITSKLQFQRDKCCIAALIDLLAADGSGR